MTKDFVAVTCSDCSETGFVAFYRPTDIKQIKSIPLPRANVTYNLAGAALDDGNYGQLFLGGSEQIDLVEYFRDPSDG
jgi:hypothetical protein